MRPVHPKSSQQNHHAKATGELPEFVIRNSKEFACLILPNVPQGGVFCPTRRRLSEGTVMAVKVRLGRRTPPLTLYGRVSWHRPGRHRDKLRTGMGVTLLPSERPKIEYLLNLAKAGDHIRSRRRHERFPVDLPVSWRPLGEQEGRDGRLRDIGRGGALFRSASPAPRADDVVLEIGSPGAQVPMAFTARVVWTDQGKNDDPGFGVAWRARDAGGSRRIRELVRRLTTQISVA